MRFFSLLFVTGRHFADRGQTDRSISLPEMTAPYPATDTLLDGLTGRDYPDGVTAQPLKGNRCVAESCARTARDPGSAGGKELCGNSQSRGLVSIAGAEQKKSGAKRKRS